MRKPMHEISTIDELVDALGGDTAVARWLNLSQPAVANWKVRGEVPAGWHLRIFARLKQERRMVDPVIFGLTREEARGLYEQRRPLASRRKPEGRAAA
jgi:hypothetical protein